MASPIVSVIIPCYNAEKNLVQCIDSIRCQTLKQIEIICVDDGSADATLDILEDFRKKDPRIQIIRQKNAGAGAARNAGLKCACGEYLSFLDADDFFEPDMLEKAVAAAETWQADYVVFRSDRYYSAKNCYEEMPWAVRNSDLPLHMPFSYRQLTDNVFLTFVGWAWDKLFRRSFVQAHDLQFQELRTTNDMLFVFSALICAQRIGVIQDVLAHQRRGESDTLSVTREKSWHCFYDALLALRQRLVQEDVYWELEKDFINYSLHFCLWHLNSLAEPSRTLLEQKLCGEWFAELGITDKPDNYFWNLKEYVQYAKIMKRSNGLKPVMRKDNTRLEEEKFAGMLGDRNLGDYLESLINPPTNCTGSVQFDQVRDQLMTDQYQWKKSQYIYWKYKIRNYRVVYTQLDSSLKDEYRKRMGQELKRAMQLGEIRKENFSHGEWSEIQRTIISSEWANQRKLRAIINHCVPDKLKGLAIKLFC